ncbi:MAG: tetratricopeptide repeat protein, partial [FCB group bacterium]
MKRLLILFGFLVIGTLLTQGFQCASPEMTTAKLAIDHHDWPKAEQSLDKELARNPKNAEAWIEMHKVKLQLGQLEGAANAIVNAENSSSEPLQKQQIYLLEYQFWVNCYNEGINFFNQFGKTKSKSFADSSLQRFRIAAIVRPENPDFLRLQGRVYEEIGDTVNAINLYDKYLQLYEDETAFSKKKSIYLNMARTDILKLLGTPVKSYGSKDSQGDSLITDLIKVDGKDIYLSFYEKGKEGFVLDGWRVGVPRNLTESESFQPLQFNIGPMASLSQIYFIRKDYKKAKDYIQIITQLDPNNVDANSFLIQIYDIQGKKGEALNSMKELVESNPTNKYYLAQYGEIFFKMDSLDQAITQYERALKIDPNFPVVLRNVAACYKNKAVIIQKEQQDKKQNDPKYKANLDEYLPYLNKSVKYFESARQTKEYKNDFR